MIMILIQKFILRIIQTKKKKWQNDFNHFSKYTLSKILKKNKIRKYSFHNSFLKVNIPKRHKTKPQHFVWTELIGNKKIVTNGTNLILKRQFLIFKK